MNIFLIAYILIMVVGLYCNINGRSKKAFCIFSGIIYFLIAALRSSQVGNDTWGYLANFTHLLNWGIPAAIAYSDKDQLFFVCLSLLGKITDNFSIVLFVVAAFFTITVWTYIYRYSDDPTLSIIVLLAFNLYQFSLTGMRQAVAMGFIVLAIMAVNEEKRISPYIFTIIGGLFHKSAFVFLVILILRHFKLSGKTLRFSSVALVAVFFFRRDLAETFVKYISERGYTVDPSTGGTTMMIVVAIVFIIALIFAKEYAQYDLNYHVQYYMGWLAVLFEILVLTQAIFFRIAFYFLLGYVTLIPNISNRVNNENNRMFLKVGFYVVLSIQYLFFTISSCQCLPYTFFWQV